MRLITWQRDDHTKSGVVVFQTHGTTMRGTNRSYEVQTEAMTVVTLAVESGEALHGAFPILFMNTQAIVSHLQGSTIVGLRQTKSA